MRLPTFPRFPLTTTPTPLMRAQRLEAALGPDSPRIYIKRDDLTGLAFGGNKARKLEYLVADARAKDATVLVTEGPVQSNHARMTAAAAILAGMRSVLVLDSRQGRAVSGNLLLDHMMGADVRIVSGKADRRAETERAAAELKASGERPYLIPTGGSSPIGALGYVAFVSELITQLLAIGESPCRLYFPTGSLGTQAGIVVGARAFSAPFLPLGIAVEDTADGLRTSTLPLARATADLVGLTAEIGIAAIAIDGGSIGPGYGIATPEGLAAIRLLARTEAIFLDPVYSAKAMAGLLGHIRAGEFSSDESVVFLHTGGGPSVFAHGESLLI